MRFNRTVYPAILKRRKRFKKFITKDEIRSIPFLPHDDEDENIKDEKTDFNKESVLKQFGYFIVYLKKREYDKLADLKSTLEYHGKNCNRIKEINLKDNEEHDNQFYKNY